MSLVQGSLMSTGSFQRELQAGVNSFAGIEFNRYAPEYSRMIEVFQSKKNYEEDVVRNTTGLMPIKAEGGQISYDSVKEIGIARYVHVNYALGGTITQEAIDDNLYGSEMERLGKALGRSKALTKEKNVAAMFDAAYGTTVYTMWDNVAIFSASHELGKGGTFSNMLSTPAQLSQAALEDADIAISGFVDSAGNPIMAMGELLVVPKSQKYVAERILGSYLQSNTANNAINALQSLNTFKEGYMINHFLANTQNWFIKTNVDNGGKFFQRSEYMGADNDFGTSNYRHKVSDRYSYGVTDPRGYFGSGNIT
jgi:hypothetical protein